MGLAVEDMVRGPAPENHAEVAADEFEEEHQGRGGGHGKALVLRQEGRAPVQAGEAHDIDEEIGDGEGPDDPVAIDMLLDESGMLRGFFRRGDDGLFLLADDLGKADVRRGILHRKEEEDRADEGDGGRDQEAPAPGTVVGGEVQDLRIGEVGEAEVGGDGRDGVRIAAQVGAHVGDDDPAAEGDGKAGADGMGHVPDRHLGRQLLGLDPLGEGLGAGRDAHALKEPVDHPEGTHDVHEGGGERSAVTGRRADAEQQAGEEIGTAEEDIDESAEQQAETHHLTGAVAVGDDADDIAGEAVDDPVEGQEKAELGLGNAEFRPEDGHREGEVFPDQIEHRVPDHQDDDGLPLPLVVLFLGCLIHVIPFMRLLLYKNTYFITTLFF